MSNRNLPSLHTRIDILLIMPALVLGITGILFIYSSGFNSYGVNNSTEYIRQIIWLLVGTMIFTGISLVKYEYFKEFSWILYFLFAGLVVVTILTGRVVNGARSWLGIGELGIQPSEFLKIATVLVLGRQLAKWGDKIRQLKYFFLSSLIVLVPMGLILIQPDLGTAMVFIPLFLFMLFIAGAQLSHVLYVVGLIATTVVFTLVPAWGKFINKVEIPFLALFNTPFLAAIIAGGLLVLTGFALFGAFRLKRQYFYYIAYVLSLILLGFLLSFALRIVLKDYQMMRLIVFLDPYVDPKGSGWNIIQSITAVGSGGFNGKGFLQGTQSHYQFLPEQSTDFIFSIISEELGFLGAVLIFSCFLVILGRMLLIIKNSKDLFAASITAGIAGMVFFHIIINIGMAIGIMPITGIPLPLVSYGGSSMMSAMLGFGIVSSVNAYRYHF